MTDEPNRPFPQTDWEQEQNDAAVQASDEHKDALDQFIEVSRQVSAESTAVAKLTRESLIADNKKFRRRNTVLVTLVSLLCLVTGGLLWRDIFVNAPQRDALVHVTQKLEECTTPGPREPTPDDPTTGHKCFDDSQERTSQAVADIVDANGNGKLDSQEILDFLKKFEVFLELADEVPES